MRRKHSVATDPAASRHQSNRRRRALGWTSLLAGALLLGGCSNDATGPDREPSDAAQAEGMARAEQILVADGVMNSARTVEDLTGGFSVGIADEAGGLEMELGGSIQPDPQARELLSTGHQLASANPHAGELREHLRELNFTMAKAAADPQPGDLLFTWTEQNLDGSVTVTQVFQDSPLAVVKVVQSTTWPNGNLLLDALVNEIFIDRGSDLADESDDIWLSLDSEIDFKGGAKLSRSVDARDQGGLQDDQRVDVVSTFLPRPDHPRLIDIVSTLTVDLHLLADEQDDRFVDFNRITRFTGVAHDGGQPRVEENLTPELPMAEGEEPCGGELSRAIYFRAASELASWTDSASWSCAGGGSLSRRVLYADGNEDSLTLTEDLQGVVHLEAIERDGTRTSGSFDEAARSFEFTTRYPQGVDPTARSVQGTVAPDDSSWQLDEQVSYLDGFVENNHLEGSENADGKTLSGSHAGRDESFSFELSSNIDESHFEGHVENDQNEVIDFTVEILPDGSRIVDFVATNPTTRVEGHLEIDPDGCGSGSLDITEDGAHATIDVTFCEDDDSGVVPLSVVR